MRVALWRLGASLQVASDSKTCGGRMAEGIVQALIGAGAQVAVYGNVKPATGQWLERQGVELMGNTTRVTGCDWALILTGPSNAMYDSVIETYARVANYEGPIGYAAWDVLLPFEFSPERVKLFRSKSAVTSADVLRNKRWYMMTQEGLSGRWKNPAQAAGVMWELLECRRQEALKPARTYAPQLAYFGSDRPGRMAEFKRWFGAAPTQVYGRWSAKSQVRFPSATFNGPVPEGEVRERLNASLGTLFMTDPAYAGADYITQRFFENAMAGTAVAYSDKTQAVIQETVGAKAVVHGPDELLSWCARMEDPKKRAAAVLDHQERVFSWGEKHPQHPALVLPQLMGLT